MNEARRLQDQFKRTEALALLDEAVTNRKKIVNLTSGPPSSRRPSPSCAS
ncbi:MAG TPA: hypothetical protein VLS89_05285 [Candidatus Nanopelagicales bacterium]|nr:hypothetical protein [Candidatus Nanopelagicales bacterium]